MNRAELLRLLDEQRRSGVDSAASVEVLPRVTRVRGRGGDWHQIAFASSTEAEVEVVIAAEVEHYRALGTEFEWTVYSHDTPRDLLRRLEHWGFEIGPREVVLVLDLANAPDWARAQSPVRVERITTSELLAAFCRVSDLVFGAAREVITAELARDMAAGCKDHVGYVAFDADRAVSIGRLNTAPASPFGGLYGGGTLPSHRGRGFYRATVAARARDAAALGARYLRVDALPTSQPILERLGFVRITEAWPCTLVAREQRIES